MNSIMIFRIGEQLFGYRTEYVSETVNIDKVFSVPKAQNYLKGLFNLRNNVVGIIDMGMLLWDKKIDSDVVVVVEKNGAQVGMLIDDVKGVANIDENHIRDISEISLEDINKDYLDCFFEHKGDIVLMVNIDHILSQRASKSGESGGSKSIIGSGTKGKEVRDDTSGYLLFQIMREWYAMEVKSINEVITYPEELSSLPKAAHHVKGIFLLRGDSVVLVDLPELLGIDDSSSRNRVILVNSNSKLIGLSIDMVRELKWITKHDVMQVDREDGIQRGMISLDDGKRLALLLDVEKIVGSLNDVVSQDGEKQESNKENSLSENSSLKTFVQFRVGDVSMALPINSVNEVVEAQKIKTIPRSPEYIEGMMNLRNSTLVVISLAKRLEIDSTQKVERIVVLDGKPVGFIVDELNGILKVEESSIFPPEESTDLEDGYLEGIIRKSDGEILFILNRDVVIKNAKVEELVERKEDGGEHN